MTVAPQRTKDAKQWKVHEVSGLDNDKKLSEAVSYRHYRSINTNWKSKRWQPVEFDGSKHVVDESCCHGSTCSGKGRATGQFRRVADSIRNEKESRVSQTCASVLGRLEAAPKPLIRWGYSCAFTTTATPT